MTQTDLGSASVRPAASQDDVLEFFRTQRDYPATSVMRTGNNYTVWVESGTIIAESTMLEGMLKAGAIDRDSALLRSLLVYETALDANLRQSTARSLLQAFRATVEQGGDSATAMQETFLNIALACEVEAYVNNQKGLAHDIRQVAEYTQVAYEHGLDEGTVDANQQMLDESLHAFTDAVADARESGIYNVAYDAQQAFFQRSATVDGTDYWQQRAATRGNDLALMQAMGNLARAKRDPGSIGLVAAAGLMPI